MTGVKLLIRHSPPILENSRVEHQRIEFLERGLREKDNEILALKTEAANTELKSAFETLENEIVLQCRLNADAFNFCLQLAEKR